VLKKKVFASWDRFILPYPLGRGLFLWGTPIYVSAETSPEQMEVKRLELQCALNAVTAEAERMVMR
jgi:lysophospholipid acyltransferase (LPLAT)-like uncharacterized protein